jgi:hypothetical protein
MQMGQAEKEDVWIPRSFRAEHVPHLLDTQRRAVRLIVARIAETVVESLEYGDKQQLDEDESRRNPNTLHLLRPHQVYCIDGGRGSGKTYTLATVQHAIERLQDYARQEKIPASWPKFFNESLPKETLDRLKTSARTRQPKAFAQVFRILFPGDQENAESLMAAIFSEMRNRLVDASSKSSATRRNLKQKLIDLIGDLERGFDAARNSDRFSATNSISHSSDGHPVARKRRTIDLGTTDFRSVEHNRIAYNRVARWREAVKDYLSFFNAATLIVLVDDSDVQSELTEDIFRTLRNYLTHPRVITIVAGNVRSMRGAMLHRAMLRIARSIPALGTTTSRTARDWRRSERRTVEEYIDKVLPPAQRFFLGPPEFHAASGAGNKSDFAKIAGCELLEICGGRLQATRAEFLTAKFVLALRREVETRDQPTEEQQQAIEAFLSWWIFANQYAAELAPRSVRQIVTFREYYVDVKKVSKGKFTAAPKKEGNVKRLPVMLHDVSDNFTLIQRLEDTDASVAAWLREQQLASTWIGQRMFSINSREAFQGSYSYDYIRYRIDVGLAMPVRDNPDEALARGLLPKFRGRRFVRRFFMPQNMLPQQRRYGVSQRIDHAAVPASCLYFYDLAAIPDISIFANDDEALRDSEPPGVWEALLAGRWPEYVDIDSNNLLIRYFTEVLCERLRHTQRITSATLMLELDPPKDKGKRGLYDAAVDNEFLSFGENWSDVLTCAKEQLTPDADQPSRYILELQGSNIDINYTAVEERRNRLLHHSQSSGHRGDGKPVEPTPTNITQAKHLLARYTAMLTDLRRAWHAVRIHEHAPSYMESGEEITARGYERAARSVLANQSRMTLYTRLDLEEILRKSEWTRAILGFTEFDNIRARWELETGRTGAPPNMDLGFLFRVNAPIKLVVHEERGDWESWALTLRRVGRAFSKAWPVYNSDDACLKDIGLDTQTNGEPERWQLPIGKTSLEDSDLIHGREARNFLLFMHGLAPSLPAIIHANVMARVYEASPGTAAEPQSGTAAEQQPDTTTELHKETTAKRQPGAKVEQRSWRLPEKVWVEQLEDELVKWGRLVGSLTLMVRYVKIQTLHLFAKLLIDGALPKGNAKAVEPNRSIFARECFFPTMDATLAEEAFECLRELFGKKISTDLALMPDIAPSSLFGERWMKDLVVTSEIRKSVLERLAASHVDRGIATEVSPEPTRDVATEVKGIFGETELWLWCANRCLRKLHNALRNATYGKEQGQDQSLH